RPRHRRDRTDHGHRRIREDTQLEPVLRLDVDAADLYLRFAAATGLARRRRDGQLRTRLGRRPRARPAGHGAQPAGPPHRQGTRSEGRALMGRALMARALMGRALTHALAGPELMDRPPQTSAILTSRS